MTYDELRDYIDKFDAAGMVHEPVVKALRAVVELHKAGSGKASRCEACYLGFDCPTIQVIEEGLSNG